MALVGQATFSGAVIASGAITGGGLLTTGGNIVIPDAGNIGSASDTDAIAIASNGQVTFTQTLIGTALDISGDIDVDGTTNLDVVDIDGAVDMASTLQVDGAITSSAGMTITTANNLEQLTLISTDTDANQGPVLRLRRDSASPADNDIVGYLIYSADNDAGQITDFAGIRCHIDDVSDGTEDGNLKFFTNKAGTEVSRMGLASGETVFNEDSVDVDFRVESNNDSSAFFVNGETGNTGFGTSTTPASISIYTNISSANNFDGVRLRNVSTSSNQYGGALFVGLLSGGIPQAQVRGPADNNGMLIFQTGSSETEHFRIAADGTLTATDTSIGSNSDSRLKKDIEDYTYDIDKFKAFRTRTFEWINKEEHGNKTNCVGFVAQEVESTDTRWVDENQINDTSGDGTTNADWNLIPENEKGIRKSKTSKLGEKDAMYISVIQQLIARIEALEDA